MPTASWRVGPLAVAVLLLLTGAASAEPLQFWLPANVAVRVHGRWGVVLGVEQRWEDGDAGLDRVLIRPAVVFEPTPGLTLWCGYGDTEVSAPLQRDDQQLWQQVTYARPVAGWTISPRVRLEERFVEGTDATSWRLRTLIRVMHPVPRLSRWNVVAFHESFFPLNDVAGSQRAGFGEGRFLVGVQRRVLPRVVLEPGFLWKFNNRPAPLKDTWNRAISVGVTVRY